MTFLPDMLYLFNGQWGRIDTDTEVQNGAKYKPNSNKDP